MSDKTKTDLALAIITQCEGVDKDRILTGYTMLRGLVDSVDMFLPLFRKVFPNAQQKLENIRMLKNRSSVYINEAVKRFQGVATDVLLDALNNKQEHFEKSWQKLVDFCVSVSEEQRYADERLTSIGKEIYHLGKADITFIKDKLNGRIIPFPEDASREFHLKDKKIKRAFFGKDEKNGGKTRNASEDTLYMLIYADMYAKNDPFRVSRQFLSMHVADELLHNFHLDEEKTKALIMTCDPMAVRSPSYPELVIQSLRGGASYLNTI